MKKVLIALFGIGCLCFLASCSCVHGSCAGSNKCWNKDVFYTKCGGCLEKRCQQSCDACTFNEPSCHECLKCMSRNECTDAKGIETKASCMAQASCVAK